MSRTSFRVNPHSIVRLNVKELLLARSRRHIWSSWKMLIRYWSQHFIAKLTFGYTSSITKPCSRVFLKTLRKSIFADNSRGGSRTAATPKMECFVIILNSWKPLTIITKLSIFDVATVLDPPLSSFFSNFHRFGEEPLNAPESIREKSHLVRIY